MQKIAHHVARLREKPHHIRKQIAFAAAAGMTGAIALVWLVGSALSGAFAIEGSSFAAVAAADNVIATTSASLPAGLAGAAAAVSAAAPARIEIVDTNPAATTTQPAPTVLPF